MKPPTRKGKPAFPLCQKYGLIHRFKRITGANGKPSPIVYTVDVEQALSRLEKLLEKERHTRGLLFIKTRYGFGENRHFYREVPAKRSKEGVLMHLKEYQHPPKEAQIEIDYWQNWDKTLWIRIRGEMPLDSNTIIELAKEIKRLQKTR